MHTRDVSALHLHSEVQNRQQHTTAVSSDANLLSVDETEQGHLTCKHAALEASKGKLGDLWTDSLTCIDLH